MRYLNLIAVIFIATLIFSCKSESTRNQLKEIEKLQAQIDSSKNVFTTINLQTIIKYKESATIQVAYLEKFYTDTIMQNARFVDVYNSNYKLMKKLIKGHSRLGDEIDFSNGQLKNLYNDIENGFAKDSVYIKYYTDEKKVVSEIIKSTETLKNWENKCVKRYNGMTTPIDSIILELQNQGYR